LIYFRMNHLNTLANNDNPIAALKTYVAARHATR